MANQWFRNLSVALLTVIFFAACSGSGIDETPAEPSTAPDETIESTVPPRVEIETESGAFNEFGEPYEPGTTRLLNRTFYFAYDQANLSPQDLSLLESHAQVLREHPDKTVVVEGHCDERGTREYNLALGERRADTVRRFLTSSGVAPGRIETVSYGEERPEDPGHVESAWGRNRRAVVLYR